jgi:hypothetical protein
VLDKTRKNFLMSGPSRTACRNIRHEDKVCTKSHRRPLHESRDHARIRLDDPSVFHGATTSPDNSENRYFGKIRPTHFG